MIDTPPPPSQEQIVEQALTACGLSAQGFTVRYVDDIESIEVVISAAAGVTPVQFPCIKDAVFPEIVTFEDDAMNEQYTAYVTEKLRAEVFAHVEVRLRELGLWDGFPERERYVTFADYIHALEAHAGFAPGSMLQIDGTDRVTVVPQDGDWPAEISYERFATMLTVLQFASVRGNFTLGFVGNDKFRE